MRIPLLLIPALAFALPPQRPEQAAPPATVVNLNVVALDAKGQSVMNLRPDELKLWDNGKPQTLATMRRRDASPKPPVTLGPREYSNHGTAGIPHATVILFDLMNMQFSDRGYVTNQLIHALENFETNENLYLYLITASGGIYAVHGLPESGSDEKPGAWTRDVQSQLNEAMRVTLARRPIDIAIDIDQRVRTTFATLATVAARLASVPGRKNIVWLTHGVPISLSPARTLNGDWVDYTPYIRQLSQTLDRADVSIYAVQQSPPGSSTLLQDASVGRNSPDTTATTGLGSEQTLQEFANLTGGRAYETNDIAGAIKQAVNDARQSYLVSYAPAAENWDGKYHKIRLVSSRKGVKLQARQGYYAFAEQAATARQVDDAFQSAIDSPFDAAEIGLTATTSVNPGALHVSLKVDLAGVELASANDISTGRLLLRFVEYQNDGAIRQTNLRTLDLRLTAAQAKEGYTVTEDLAITPQIEKIRAVVFDPGSAAVGSLTIPLVR